MSAADVARQAQGLALAIEKYVPPSPPNLASLVLLIENGRRILLTGDAGVGACSNASPRPN